VTRVLVQFVMHKSIHRVTRTVPGRRTPLWTKDVYGLADETLRAPAARRPSGRAGAGVEAPAPECMASVDMLYTTLPLHHASSTPRVAATAVAAPCAAVIRWTPAAAKPVSSSSAPVRGAARV